MAQDSESRAAQWLRRIVAVLLAVIGLVLAVGGAVLLAAGGSFYYLLTGLAVTVSGVLIGLGDARGVWLYGAMLVWTVAWSIWEVGSTAGSSHLGLSRRSSSPRPFCCRPSGSSSSDRARLGARGAGRVSLAGWSRGGARRRRPCAWPVAPICR